LSCVWESYGKFPLRTLKTISVFGKIQDLWEFP